MLHDRLDIGLMFSFRNPAQWRRPFAEVYADELALIRRAEALGVDTIWFTEHHFVDDGYSPSVVTIAAAIAAVTERVRIGFNLLLLPLHNAVRVAEDIATADVISGGRLDPGFGQGYAPHEFAGYGIPLSERLSRFVEGLDVVQGLWSQDTFSYEGRHYHIDNARLVPKPVQDPMPLWIGATTVPAVRRAGRRGANLLGTGSALLPAYEEARREGGFGMQDAKVLQFHFGHLAPSEDDAWDEAGARFHHLMSVYQDFANASGGQGGPKPGQVPPIEELRNPKTRLMFRPAIGDPAGVAAMLERSLRGNAATTHLAIGVLPGMAPAHTQRSMELLVREVVPRLP